MFTQEDLNQISIKGIDIKTIEKQLENFKKGFPFIKLVEPAVIGNGIKKYLKADLIKLSQTFIRESFKYRLLKFVPASGAATRMFKDLIALRNELSSPSEKAKELFNEEVRIFFESLEKFAFYEDLKNVMSKDGFDLENYIQNSDYKVILDYLLTEKGLNFQSLPKSLLKFHKYENVARMAFDEHLVEAAEYCRDNHGNVFIHFTVADEFYDSFTNIANNSAQNYGKSLGVNFRLSFSVQKPSTDIIAVDIANTPFRDDNGNIVFRPGGHGALIENLNDCDSDIIFIKNIDNIIPDRLKASTFLYKKALCGLLIELQQKIAQYLEMLESNETNEEMIKDIEDFSIKYLNLKIERDYKNYSRINKINYLYFLLNRPIRICGMVRNTGEPGGGPFWINESSGAVSLQIVETSQINLDDSEQFKIFKRSSYFNPADLVCFVRDYKGNKFDLREYIDETTGFISVKSKDGKELKAQELPGLWNGAMADWITLFVEVPLQTFNPVKTVNDLLRPEHQNI